MLQTTTKTQRITSMYLPVSDDVVVSVKPLPGQLRLFDDAAVGDLTEALVHRAVVRDVLKEEN